MSNAPKSSRDHLTASTTIELTEQELNGVTGGAVDAFMKWTPVVQDRLLNFTLNFTH